MKKLLTLTILTTLSLFGVELDWLHNYDKALEIAKKEHKGVYLLIGADKCRFCEMYKQAALIKPEVIKAIDKEYVRLYLSRDQHFIPDKFERFGAPRHYFLDSNGKIFYQDAGFKNAQGVYDMLDDAEVGKND